MLKASRLLLAVVATAGLTQPVSAFWCHHCSSYKQVTTVRGTGAPGGAFVTGGNTTGLTAAPGGAFLVPGSTFLTPGSTFLTPGSTFLAPGSSFPNPGSSFPAPGSGFQVNPAPNNPAPNNPAPTGAPCATTAEVQALLKTRFDTTDAAIASLKASTLTDAQVRAIVKDEVSKQLKTELTATNDKITALNTAVDDLKKNAITKTEVEAMLAKTKKELQDSADANTKAILKAIAEKKN